MENNKRNKLLLGVLVMIALVILVLVGSTYAYFSISATSNENAVSVGAAEFKLELEEDTDLIKGNVIPSIEQYVDIASKRVDNQGNFLKPYTENNNLVTAGTACIDDNLYAICSMYTFTVINRMTDTDIPLYITLNPSVNTFQNLYYKVLDSSLNEVISATPLVDDSATNNGVISPEVLTNINTTLTRASNSTTPSTVKYTIVLWIMENGENQNNTDGGSEFAATLNIQSSASDGTGITGKFTMSG